MIVYDNGAYNHVSIIFYQYLDNRRIFHYNILAIGVWRSLVSRLVRVQEASGSNPDTPTTENSRFCSVKVAKTAVFIEQGS